MTLDPKTTPGSPSDSSKLDLITPHAHCGNLTLHTLH